MGRSATYVITMMKQIQSLVFYEATRFVGGSSLIVAFSILSILSVVPTTGIMAQSPVSLSIYPVTPADSIPADFTGISVEMGSLISGRNGVTGNWFDDATAWPQEPHLQMITLFKNLGIKNIRVGGGSVDQGIAPANSDIDAFFRFVKAAGQIVEYSVELLNGDSVTDAGIVQYIWSHYGQYVRCIEIGNEPDFHSYHTYPGHVVDPEIYETTPGVPGTAFPSYLAKWKNFASTISTAVPDVKFGGPDTGSNWPIPNSANTTLNGLPWTVQFADSTIGLGDVNEIFFHNYVGQGASGTPQSMADAMLSTTWDDAYYQELYDTCCIPLLRSGLRFRLTESNSFSGGLLGGSNSYATSLFALDYLHWWAAHNASGVNFHNKQWVLNDAIYQTSADNYQVHPMGYGIAAFNVGGHGAVDSVAIGNPAGLDLTAYAVEDSAGILFVTIINKEHHVLNPYTPAPRDAEVSISAIGFPDTASVMYLMAPGSNVLDTTGMTLGGTSISSSRLFAGKWSPIDTVQMGRYVVSVPRASAAIVRIGGPFTYLPAPVALQPSKGDSGVPRSTSFDWTTSAGSSLYELQIASDARFQTVVYDTSVSDPDTTLQLATPLNPTTKYYWRILASDSEYTSAYSNVDSFTTGTGVLSIDAPTSSPDKFDLSQNYPNPFNPTTVITYQLPMTSNVTLKVYDVLGREVAMLASGRESAGTHSVSFNGGRLPSGVYFYRLSAGNFTATKKTVLMK